MRSPVPVYRIEQTHHTQVIAGQYIVVTDLALPSSPRRRLLAAAAALVKPIAVEAPDEPTTRSQVELGN